MGGNVGNFDFRSLFADVLITLSKKLSFFVKYVSPQFLWASINTVVWSVLQLTSNAPEGCTTTKDLHNNIAVILHLLLKGHECFEQLLR